MDRRYERLVEAARALAKQPRSKYAHAKLSHMLDFKICRMCQKEKSFSEFGKQETTFDGYRNHCKVCRSEARR